MEDNSEQNKEEPSKKAKKAEKFIVEGTNWKVGVTVEPDEFPDLDSLLIECATRGVEYAYYSNPTGFKLGAYIQITYNRKIHQLRWVNSFTVLVNASLFKLATKLRENVLHHQKIDIEKEKTVV